MKISRDTEDPLDELTIRLCNLVRNMVYSTYQEKDYVKARRNGQELIEVVAVELANMPKIS